MKIKIRRIIFLILTLSTFIIIFMFSNQDAKESSATSRGFTKDIIEIVPVTKNLEENQKNNLIENSQKFIRKLAHFSVYTLAGINLMGFMKTYDKLKLNKRIMISILIGIIYASTDEFHQMFSGGRTPAVTDVCIDTLGVIFGNLIFLGIDNIKNKIKSK